MIQVSRSMTIAAAALIAALTTAAIPADAQPPGPPGATNELILQLAAGPDRPQPEEVVRAVNENRPIPAGIGVGHPRRGWELLPRRAKGATLAWFHARPEEPRAKLERTIVLAYPERANISAIAEALGHNPNVEHVSRNLAFHLAVSPGRKATTPEAAVQTGSVQAALGLGVDPRERMGRPDRHRRPGRSSGSEALPLRRRRATDR
jgi:hypothetical protein